MNFPVGLKVCTESSEILAVCNDFITRIFILVRYKKQNSPESTKFPRQKQISQRFRAAWMASYCLCCLRETCQCCPVFHRLANSLQASSLHLTTLPRHVIEVCSCTLISFVLNKLASFQSIGPLGRCFL